MEREGQGRVARKRDRRALAADPNTSKEELEKLAERHPFAFLSNPLVGLLLMEDPSWAAPRAARRAIAVKTMRREVQKTVPDWVRFVESGTGLAAAYGSGTISGGGMGCREFRDGSGPYGDCYGASIGNMRWHGTGAGQGEVQDTPCTHT